MLKIFIMDVDVECEETCLKWMYDRISKERKQRTDRLKKEKRKKEILTSYFLQYGISSVIKVPIECVSFCYGKYGKPYLKKCETVLGESGFQLDVQKAGECSASKRKGNRRLEKCEMYDFSLSHSGKYAILAIGDCKVGVDIEKKRKGSNRIAKRFFCESEYNEIMACLEEEREKRFLEYWTMKEAYVKREGKGLSISLDSFEIERKDGGMSKVKGKETYFVTWEMEEGYMVSVCSENETELHKICKNSLGELSVEWVTVNQLCDELGLSGEDICGI